MFKFLHAADLHLDSPLKGLERYPGAPVEEIRGASRRALENMVQLAIDESVEFVLIAGDVYDGEWKFFDTGLFFVDQMLRLRDASIDVVLISGNHDAQSVITKALRLRLPSNVRQLSVDAPETVELDDVNVAIHGQGFARREVFDELHRAYPRPIPGRFNIGMLHTSMEGREGHSPYAPCSLRDLTSFGYDYWALGHIHKREEVCKDPWVVFPGNLQGRDAGETGRKGATLVKVDGAKVTAEHRDLDAVRWENEEIDLTSCATNDDALSLVTATAGRVAESAGERLVAIRLRFTGGTAIHSGIVEDPDGFTNAVRAALMELGRERFWLEKAQIQTRAPFNVEDLIGRDDPPGYLMALLRRLPEDDTACAELALQLREIKQKLPPELQYSAPGIPLDDARTVRALASDVEQILLPRLLGA